MRIGVYAREWQMAAAESHKGFTRLGHQPHFRRHSVFKSGDTEDFGAVLTVGFGEPGSIVAEAYRAKGVPVITMDAPWLAGKVGMPVPDPAGDVWRLSLGGHDWLFPAGCPADRAQLFGAEPSYSPGRRGSKVLVCGQIPGDSAHRLGSVGAVTDWGVAILEELRNQYEAPYIWRAHPGAPAVRPPGYDGYSDPAEPLEADLRSAYALVTISSGAGAEALLAGVPVVALGPCAYDHLAVKIKGLPRLKPPKRDNVADFGARLAYQHWTRAEIDSGKPLELFLKIAAGEEIKWPTPKAPPPEAPKPKPREAAAPSKATPATPPKRNRRKATAERSQGAE